MFKKRLSLYALLVFSLFSFGYAYFSSISGKISLIGNTPFTDLVIADNNQKFLLNGSNLIKEELKNLQGATVRLTGTKTNTKSFYGFPEFEVKSYELLWVGENNSRKKPWVGFIVIEKKIVYFKSLKGKLFNLGGPAKSNLENYPHAKLWITGTLKRAFWMRSTIIPDGFGIINKNP